MFITNGNERLTVPTEAGGAKLCKMNEEDPARHLPSVGLRSSWETILFRYISLLGLGLLSSTSCLHDLPLHTCLAESGLGSSHCPSDL